MFCLVFNQAGGGSWGQVCSPFIISSIAFSHREPVYFGEPSLASSWQQKSSPLGPPNAKLPSNHPPAEVTFDGTTHFVNASSMNEHYQCIHAPLVFVSWLQFQWYDAQTINSIAVPFAQPALVQNCSNKDFASQSSTFPPSPKGQSATHSFNFSHNLIMNAPWFEQIPELHHNYSGTVALWCFSGVHCEHFKVLVL